jgi:tRNA pseudouridine32 synthase/23S rRNA pseudouridine746 synthase
MTPEDICARVLYRDGLILVIDKPCGAPVHRGPKGGYSLEDDFEHLRFGLPRKPSLAHRLDRETSGCLVLGRHHKALEKLGKLFAQGRVAKSYWAVVEGGPEADEGFIDKPLGRRDPQRGWWMKVDPAGLPSQTRWRVRGRGALDGKPLTWLEMTPLTGRTHQLRVHAASEGFPLLGEAIYAARPLDGPPLHLLARRVEIPLASAKPPIVVEAPVPPHMREALAACGFT